MAAVELVGGDTFDDLDLAGFRLLALTHHAEPTEPSSPMISWNTHRGMAKLSAEMTVQPALARVPSMIYLLVNSDETNRLIECHQQFFGHFYVS